MAKQCAPWNSDFRDNLDLSATLLEAPRPCFLGLLLRDARAQRELRGWLWGVGSSDA